MAKKWIALNVLLLLAAFGLARELYQQYEQFKTKTDPVKIEPVFVENQTALKTASGVSTDTSVEKPVQQDDDDYFIISENTLFSDTRGLGETSPNVALQPVPPLNPKPVLVGTIMIDGMYTASIIDPGTQQPRGGPINTETRRIGDFYRGYKITEIEAEQMALENGGRREVISLNRNSRRQPQNARAAAVGARVVSIGPGGGTSGEVAVTTASTAASGRVVQPTAAQNAAARQAQTQQNQRTSVSISPNDEVLERIAVMQETLQPNPQTRPAQKPKPEIDAQSGSGARQRVIRSPFGDITRPGLE